MARPIESGTLLHPAVLWALCYTSVAAYAAWRLTLSLAR